MSVVTVAKGLAGVRGAGWRENAADERDRVFVPQVVRRAPAKRLFAGGHLTDSVPHIFDQGATSSCVAQAICGAVSTREMWLTQRMNLTRERTDLFSAALYAPLSRRALYSLARASHGDQKNDGGTYIRGALQVMRRHGCPLERDFAWSELRINQTVPAPLLHAGYAFAELEYESIVAVGDDKLEQVRAALREGFPVVFGGSVTRSYSRLRKHTTPYEPIAGEPVLGGHAQYIVDVDNDGHCTIANSWGRDFGNDGFAYVHREWVKRVLRDLTIIKNWRRVRAAEQEVRRAA